MSKLLRVLVILTSLLLGLSWSVVAAPPLQRPSNQQLLDKIKQNTQNKVRISYHAETGKINFIGTDPANTIAQPSLLPANANPEVAARGFLAEYGSLFGLSESDELSVMKQNTLDDGRSFVRFQQHYQDIPIVGGELIIQANASRDIISANGEILPDLKLNITPGIKAEAARQAALSRVAKIYGLDAAQLTASAPELWIFNPALLGGPGPRLSSLVWRTEVTPIQLLPIREFVLVDAQRGGIVLNFNRVDTAKNRKIYDNNNNPALGLPGNGPVRTEGQSPSAITDVNLAYDYSGNTYDFYFANHGRDSLNGAGLILISTTRYCDPADSCPYANAFWNGIQMAYGQGFAAADDVVGHELTHGVTEFESGLFYYYQSGAINESFSDVWGEFVDLTYNTATDNDTAAVRWQLGEDVPGFGTIRNMQNPPAFNDPDRITSPNYVTGPVDSGGVHSNSGVNNKAAFLLTDGATFNGQTVTGLGITKVAKIYYEVQTNLLVSGSDYADLYNSLYQACQNLIGKAGITASNCQEVRDATNAVEMNQQPVPNFNTDAPFCAPNLFPDNVFSDDFESGVGKWTFGVLSGTQRWGLDSPYGSFAHSGVHFLYADDFPDDVSDSFAAMKNSVTLPANAFLHFAHAYGFESEGFDGGILEYSTNGGTSWTNAAGLFNFNGADGTINAGFGNPLGGQSGFLDDSHGYISSRLNLVSLAGQNVRFRWRMGTDPGSYDWGWWLDDVRIYRCVALVTGPNKAYLPAIIK
jgi:bacillolysin